MRKAQRDKAASSRVLAVASVLVATILCVVVDVLDGTLGWSLVAVVGSVAVLITHTHFRARATTPRFMLVPSPLGVPARDQRLTGT